jgi:hypothetical protein
MAGYTVSTGDESDRAEMISDPKLRAMASYLPSSMIRSMGMAYRDSFLSELAVCLQQQRTTLDEIGRYLVENQTKIERAVDFVKHRVNSEDEERIRYIVTSAFVASYLNGLPPAILLAICEQESGFSFPAESSGVGPWQLTAASAVGELNHPDTAYRERKIEDMRNRITRMGGPEFIGIVNGPVMRIGQSGAIYASRSEMSSHYQYRALESGDMAAKTLLAKGEVNRNMITSDRVLRDLFIKYNGSDNKLAYGNSVLSLYHLYERAVERPTNEQVMNSVPVPVETWTQQRRKGPEI